MRTFKDRTSAISPERAFASRPRLVEIFGKLLSWSKVKILSYLGLLTWGLFAAETVWAEDSFIKGIGIEAVNSIMGFVVGTITQMLGALLTLFIDKVLINVATYNHFTDTLVVVQGWETIRDVGNMFFIVILLIIAFATILGLESYQWKKLLPKLVIIAVLVNFSRSLVGLLIDFSQVIMLTFVNGFAAASAGNFANILQIDKILTIAQNSGQEVSISGVVGTYILGLAMVTIALIVVAIFVIMLIFRIVSLWIITIMAPAAFIASVVPGGQKYASEWWEELSKNLITGPAIAFFLWLTLATVASVPIDGAGTGPAGSDNVAVALSQITQWDNLMRFLIAIIMLMGSLVVASRLGAAGAKLAGEAMSKITGTAEAIIKKPFSVAASLGKGALVSAEAATTKGWLNPSVWKENIEHGYKGWLQLQHRSTASKIESYAEEGVYGGLKAAGQDTMTWRNKRILRAKQAEKDEVEAQRREHIESLTNFNGATPEQQAQMKSFTEWYDAAAKRRVMLEQRLKAAKLPGEKAPIQAELDALAAQEQQLRDSARAELPQESQYLVDSYGLLANRRADLGQEMHDLEHKIEHHIPSTLFVEDTNFRKAVGEEQGKLGKGLMPDSTLITLFDQADHANNIERMGGVLTKLASDGNFNEILLKKAGDSGYDGFIKFFKDIEASGKYDVQKVRSIADQVSQILETTGFYNAGARTVTRGADGELQYMDKKDHQAAINAELKKKGISSLKNRYSMFAERMIDDGRGGKKRVHYLTEAGGELFRELVPNVARGIDRGDIPTKVVELMVENKELLAKVVEDMRLPQRDKNGKLVGPDGETVVDTEKEAERSAADYIFPEAKQSFKETLKVHKDKVKTEAEVEELKAKIAKLVEEENKNRVAAASGSTP